jgi:hypothetical protein
MATEFQVNTSTTGAQTTYSGFPPVGASQTVGVDANGNFVIAWTGVDAIDGFPVVFARRFDKDGNPLGDEFRLNTFTSDQLAPSVGVANSTGDFVITWTSQGQDGSSYGVYGQRYAANGAPASASEFKVNTTTIGDQQYSSVAVDADGDFVVTWTSAVGDGNSNGIFARRFDKNGNPLDATNFLVNNTTLGNQQNSKVAIDATGNFVVTWVNGASATGGGSNTNVYARRYDKNGNALGSEFLVNTYTTNGQYQPAIAEDVNGNFIIAWASNGQDGSLYGIFAQRYNAAGQAVGSEFQVNTTTLGDQESPSIAIDATGNFVITWASNKQDGSRFDIYAQRYTSTGSPIGSEFRINDTTTNDQRFATVGIDNGGDFVVAWTSGTPGTQDGDGLGVYAKQVPAIQNTPPTVNSFSEPPILEDPPSPLQFQSTDFTKPTVYSDPENDPLVKIQITVLPQKGTLSVNGITIVTPGTEIPVAQLNGLTYQPDPNANGPDSFQWKGFDGINYSINPATVSLTITPVPDPPVVNPINKSGTEDTPVNFQDTDFTGAFVDVDGNPLTKIQITSLPSGGTLKLGNAPVQLNQEILATDLGSLVFTPTLNFNGDTSFGWNGFDGVNYANNPSTVNLTLTPVNDPPVVSNITKPGLEDTFLPLAATDFINAFSDPDTGDSLQKIQITSLPAATSGTLTLNNSPVLLNQEISKTDLDKLAFSPALNFTGPATFGWNGSDGVIYAVTGATVNLNFAAVETAPTVQNVTKSSPEDAVLTFAATDFTGAFNDVDPGDSLQRIRITQLPAVDTGTLQLNNTDVQLNQEIVFGDLGNLTFTPAPNFNGPASFGWNGSDGRLYAATGANVNLTITPVNDAPQVQNITEAGSEDTPFTFSATDFNNAFSDVDTGDSLQKIQITSLPAATSGTLTFNSTPVQPGLEIPTTSLSSLVFTPVPNFNGPISFGWNGSDGLLYATTGATVNLNIGAVNDPPTVQNISKSGDEDNPIPFAATDFTGAFSDPDITDSLKKIQITLLPVGGTLQLNGTAVSLNQEILLADLGNLSFVPNLNFNGPSSFGWNGSDGSLYANQPATVDLTINPVNDAPTVSNISKPSLENTVVTFTAADFTAAFLDVDTGDSLQKIQITSLPANGTLQLGGTAVQLNQEISVTDLGTLTFTPTTNFNGPTSFGWDGSDGLLYAATGASVNLNFAAVNNPPTVSNINKGGPEDTVISFTTNDFAAAFSDVDPGNNLAKIKIISLPTGGVLRLGGTLVQAGQEIAVANLGSLTFNPAPNFNGPASFGWNGSDGTLYATTGAVVNLAIAPVNDPPTLSNITKAGTEDTAFTFSAADFTGAFSDPDTSDSLQKIQIISLPTGGTLQLGGTAVSLNQEIPVAALDTLTLVPGTNVNGSVSFSWNGYDGTTYALAPATATVNLAAVNDPPTVNSITKAGSEDIPLTFAPTDFTSVFSDPDIGDSLQKIQITALPDPATGSLTLNGAAVTLNQEISTSALGSLVFTPTSNFSGQASFGWNGSDGALYAGTGATATLNFAFVNKPPTVSNINKPGSEDTVLTFSVADFTGAFSDPDAGDALQKVQITSLPNPATGTLTLNGTAVTLNQEILTSALGGLVFTPTPNFNGPVTFGWNGFDGTTYAATGATVNLAIAAVNDAPTVSNITKAGTEDTTFAFSAADFTAVFTDPDTGDSLQKIQITSLPTGGILQLGGVGVTLNQEIPVAQLDTLTLVPAANVAGPVTFNWTGSDGTTYAPTAATATVNLAPVEDPPTVNPITKAGSEDIALTFAPADFTSVFSDPDTGDSLQKIQITALPDPVTGSLTLNGAAVTLNQEIPTSALGGLVFTPASNFNGQASFGWNGSDGTLYASTGTTATLNFAFVNKPPTVSNINKPGSEDIALTFSVTDFTGAFSDPDAGDALQKVQITALPDPATGILTLNGTAVTLNQEILTSALGGLVFTPAPNFNGPVTFGWNGFDGTTYAATGATVNLAIAAVNDAPTVSNITKAGTEDTPFAFSAADFTGAFSDPDVGDSLQKIQITSLPTGGTLQLGGVAVTLNQEIPVAALDTLTLVPGANVAGTVSFNWNGSDGNTYALAAATATVNLAGVEDPPTVIAITKAGTEDIPLTFTAADFTGAFSDPDVGDSLQKIQITALPDPVTGSLTLNGAAVTLNQEIPTSALGGLVFTPASNFSGQASFGWNGSDGALYAGTGATATLNFAFVNKPPTVSNINKPGSEDTVLTFSVTDFTGAFSDPDAGDALQKVQITALPDPATGILTLNGTAVTLNQEILTSALGGLVFTPTPNFNGPVTFGWNGFDGTTYAATGATVNLAIAPVNDPPTLSNITKAGTEDTPFAFSAADFTGAFSDPDVGDSLQKIQITSLPTSGTLQLGGVAVTLNQEIPVAALNTLTLIPGANVAGPVTFNWNGFDGKSYALAAATATVNLAGVEDPPTVIAITKAGTEDTPLVFTGGDFTGAFSDPDVGDSLQKIQITALPDPATGALSVNGAAVTLNQEILTSDLGSLVFTPAPNFNGPASFGWNGSDGTLYAGTGATVTLNFTPVIDPPTVSNISKAGVEDTVVSFTTADFTAAFNDVDNKSLAKIQITSLPTGGTLSLGSTPVQLNQEIAIADLGTLTFTPDLNVNGPISFGWNGSDGTLYAVAGATVNLNLAPVNDPPIVTSIAKTGTEDTPLSFTAADFTGAFSDVDTGDSLQKIQITALPLPIQGALTLNSLPVQLNQEILVADLGNLVFVPAPNFNGAASFGWNASDGSAYASTGAIANLTITATSDPPTIGPSPIADQVTNEDTPTGAIAFTVADPDTPLSSLVVTVTSSDPSLIGNIAFGNPNSTNRTLIITPAANQFGNAVITLTVSDGTQQASTQFNLTVNSVNDPPTITDINQTVSEGTAIAFKATDFTSVFSDVDVGDSLTAIQVTSLPPAASGTLTLNGTVVVANQVIAVTDLDKLSFTPAPNFNGPVSFNWNATDGKVYATTGAKVNLTYTPVNNAPTVSNINKAGVEDTTLVFTASDFTAAFTDLDTGDTLQKIQITSLPTGGTLLLGSTPIQLNQEIPAAQLGNLSFQPNPNVNGPISFGWNGFDGTTYATSGATVTVNLAPVNDFPTITDVNKTGNEDTSIPFAKTDFTTVFSDVDTGDQLVKIQITSLPAASDGTLALNGIPVLFNQEILATDLGNLVFTPAHNFSGTVSFSWNGSDGFLYAQTGANVVLTINTVNDPPTVTDINKTANEDTTITFAANDFRNVFTDINGDSLSEVQITTLPAASAGVLALSGVPVTQGQKISVAALDNLTFAPAANFNGPVNFGWNGSDGRLYAVNPAQVALTITPVNDPPVVATTATPIPYTPGAGAIALDPNLTVTDPDSPQLTGATITLLNFDPTQDSLSFSQPISPGITSSINGGSITLTGIDTLANYLAALKSVTYTNSSTTPNTLDRTIQFSVVDDTNAVSNIANRTIQIAVNPSVPIITPSTNGPLVYPENAGAVLVDQGVTITDADSALLSLVKVAIVGYNPNGQESLGFKNQNGITGSFNTQTGILTLTGLSAIANYQNALRSLTYENDSDNPNPTNRTIQISVSDDKANSSNISRDIQIIPINDPPVAFATRGTIPYRRDMGAIVLEDTLMVSDPDNTTLTGATVTILNYTPGQSSLGFTNQKGITGDFNLNTGVLTLAGVASVSDYQTALRSVTYTHTNASLMTLPQTVQIQVNDGAATSNLAPGTVQVVFDNTPPVLDLNGTKTGIDFSTAGAVGVAIPIVDPGLTVSDIDNSTLASATISIIDPQSWRQEQLSVDTSGTAIAASYNPNLEQLSLTGTASVADYQKVLRTVTYSAALTDSKTTTRSIQFVVDDGEDDSVPATTTLNFNPIQSNNNTSGGPGVSLVTTPQQDIINAPNTDDTVTSTLANLQQNDTINGGGGIDTLVLSDGSGTFTVDVDNPTNQVTGITPNGATITNFERFDFSGVGGHILMIGSDSRSDYLVGGPGCDTLRGRGGDDVLIGNDDVDVLDGGSGADRMVGGGGNDLYIVDNPGDVVVEDVNGGIDTVQSSINYTLGANVENLSLTSPATQGTGNALNNIITGNALNNTLVGGDGNDTLIGGVGRDRLIGGNGDDVLIGGAGRDRLIGGAGRDIFQLDSSRDKDNVITDFNPVQDTIIIGTGFSRSLRKGKIKANQFTVGDHASNLKPCFIYNQGTGQLYFDPDGMGSKPEVQIARLVNKPTLTRSDIVVNG